MTPIVSPAIESYMADLFGDETPLLAALRAETATVSPAWQMLSGPLVGRFLRLLAQSIQAKVVLEIGTFTGYSALWIAGGMAADGRLITCDVDPDTGALAQRYFAQAQHGARIEAVLGPALTSIETFRQQGIVVDFVFIDADKVNYLNYYEAAFALLRPGGIIVADNTLWSGNVLNPQDDDSRAIHAYNHYVANDKRVDAILLPLRDGLTVARKKN